MTIELNDGEKIERVRALNDAARRNPGGACRANMTIGFAALEDRDRHAAMIAIMTFDQFHEGNDPYGEHDFGAVYRLHTGGEWVQRRPEDEKVIEETVFWKIDCYDQKLEFGSEAPWDAAQTTRVLTIMLASEY